MGSILFIKKKRIITVTPIKYGLLYNWYAATDVRNITPVGWRIPTFSETIALYNYLINNGLNGGSLKQTLLTYWNTPNTGATNILNFNGRGSGMRSASGFTVLKGEGHYWNSDQANVSNAYDFWLSSSSSQLSVAQTLTKLTGISIRMCRSASASEQLLANGTSCGFAIGNDGKVYDTIKIGALVFISNDLAETKFRNGDLIPFAGANGINFTNAEWAALTTAGCCPYNNDWSNVLL